jgi:hypothetical protein
MMRRRSHGLGAFSFRLKGKGAQPHAQRNRLGAAPMGAPQGEAQIAYARTSTVPALSLFESTLDPRAYQPVGTFDGPSVGIDWMATMSRRLPFVI